MLRLDGADNLNPSISSDGRWLYFASNAAGFYQIWRTPTANPSADPELVLPALQISAEAFAEESPDGSELYYSTPSGIAKTSLPDRKDAKMVYQGSPAWFRLTSDGVLFQLLTAVRTEKI